VLLSIAMSWALPLAPGPLLGQVSSDEGAPFLLLPVGAQSVALGGAVTALSGPESAFWNPAGLASLDRSRLVFLRGDLASGTSTALSALLVRRGAGTLGVSYLLLDTGDQEYTDRDGAQVGSLSVRNHLVVFSAAAPLLPGVRAGVNFKIVQFRLSCRGLCGGLGTASSAYALDAGVHYEPVAGGPLRIGAMIAHLGPRFQQENAAQADPLPTRIRVGVAYDVLRRLDRDGLEGWVIAELQDRPGYAGGGSVFMGTEVTAGRNDALFVRAGYASDGARPGGASAGFGLRFETYEISVAKALAASAFSDVEAMQVTFSVVF
jgi:hypothetical protein